jgi:predicted nucleotide-binding protein
VPLEVAWATDDCLGEHVSLYPFSRTSIFSAVLLKTSIEILSEIVGTAISYIKLWRTFGQPTQQQIPRGTMSSKPTRVFIIHGRNQLLVDELRKWLDAMGLDAKGFDELRADMRGSPTIMDVVQKGIDEADAVLALFTPDEIAFLRPQLQTQHDKEVDRMRWQARPNVIFETGLAFGLAGRDKTLILVAGDLDLFSDVGGVHYMRVPQDAAQRETLRRTLVAMGLNVRLTAEHHKRGDFAVSNLEKLETAPPFHRSP